MSAEEFRTAVTWLAALFLASMFVTAIYSMPMPG